MKKYLVLISIFAAMQSSKAMEEILEGNDIQGQIRNNHHYGLGEQSESFKSIYLEPSLTPEELSSQIKEYIRLHTEWVNKKAAEATQQPEAPKSPIAPRIIPNVINNDDDDGIAADIPYIPYISSRVDPNYDDDDGIAADIPYIPYVSSRVDPDYDDTDSLQMPSLNASNSGEKHFVKAESKVVIPVAAPQAIVPAPISLEVIYQDACGHMPLLLEAHNTKFPNNKITPLNIDELNNMKTVATLLAEKMSIPFELAYEAVDKISNPD
ncbi:MAG: hypothetical protein FJX03_00220 [Alphaproteobacteria bacterium]|nr:hypothetical protein [Alphaproteobacteria bacterium]